MCSGLHVETGSVDQLCGVLLELFSGTCAIRSGTQPARVAVLPGRHIRSLGSIWDGIIDASATKVGAPGLAHDGRQSYPWLSHGTRRLHHEVVVRTYSLAL